MLRFICRLLPIVLVVLSCADGKGVDRTDYEITTGIKISVDGATPVRVGDTLRITVTAYTADDGAAKNRAITFEARPGDGSIFGASTRTDEIGIASARWVLGPQARLQQMAVLIDGGGQLIERTPEPQRSIVVDVTGPNLAFGMVGDTKPFPTFTAADRYGNAVPSHAANLTWTSRNTNIATVDSRNGITAAGLGSTWIIANGEIGGSDSVLVTVARTAGAVSLAGPSGTLFVGGQYFLIGKVLDRNGQVLTDEKVSWKSNNTGVVTVDANGLMIAQGWGQTDVTASFADLKETFTARVVTLDTAGALKAASIASAPRRTCALSATGAATCWGLLEIVPGATPINPLPAPLPGGKQWRSLAGGTDVCGLTTDRQLYCIMPTGPVRTDSGAPYTTFVGYGSIYCGLNDLAETHCFQATPPSGHRRELLGATMATVGVGNAGICGVATDGTLYCSRIPNAARVPGDRKYRTVAVGGDFRCAIALDGDTYCWGSNFRGQLGSNVDSYTEFPTRIGTGHKFVSIVAGAEHACGVVADGTLFCWGRNLSGELGDGTTTNRSLPTPVSGGLRFRTTPSALGAGDNYTCAIATTDHVYCWGSDSSFGALGQGIELRESLLTPVPVRGPN